MKQMMISKSFTIGDSSRQEMTLVARGAECVALATRIYTDDESEDGIIQADAMLSYFPGQPELHTTTNLCAALLAAGCQILGR